MKLVMNARDNESYSILKRSFRPVKSAYTNIANWLSQM